MTTSSKRRPEHSDRITGCALSATLNLYCILTSLASKVEVGRSLIIYTAGRAQPYTDCLSHIRWALLRCLGWDLLWGRDRTCWLRRKMAKKEDRESMLSKQPAASAAVLVSCDGEGLMLLLTRLAISWYPY